MKLKDIWTLLKDTYHQWSEDKASRLAAALSYYTIFSLAPLLVIAIAITGLVYGQQAAQNQIVGQIQGLVGHNGAQAIQTMIEGARKPSTSIIATIIGIILLLFGAAGLFGQLQDALNTIWEVTPKPNQGVWAMIKERFLSFTMVLGIGFLLLVSLVISATLSALGVFITGLLPGMDILLQVVNFVVSFAVVTFLFAMIFKYLPDAEIAWRDVWLGAIVTAFLFTVGKFLIGLYLGRSSVTSSYGAAGSLVVILLWVYYSGQILFFGAEFTQVYANKFGSHIVPEPDAIKTPGTERGEQGIPHRPTVERAGRQGNAARPSPSQSPVNSTLAQQADQRAAYHEPQRVERPRSPAQKSMTALGAIVLVLVGYVASLVARSRRH